MVRTKILTVIFTIVALGIGTYLYSSIQNEIEEERRINKYEALIKEKLLFLRDLQQAYEQNYSEYVGSWDTLRSFLDTGKYYITERRETVIPQQYGNDSIVVEIDTLGIKQVKDSIFNIEGYGKFKGSDIGKVPGTDTTFQIWSGQIEQGGVNVDIFEIKDPAPINPERQEGGRLKPLAVGSRQEVSTSGNWQ